jgi:hypothetical protein
MERCDDFGWGERAAERAAQYEAECRAMSEGMAFGDDVTEINATLDAWSRDPLTAVCPEPSFLPCNEEDDLPWL